MKQRALRLTCILLLTGVLMVAGLLGPAITQAANLYVPNQYIIHVKSGTNADAVEQMVDAMGASLVRPLPLSDTYLIEMGKRGTDNRSNAFRTTRSSSRLSYRWLIDRIQPNVVYSSSFIPDDEYWPKQWDMRMIKMPQAWEIQTGDSAVTVAVLDTGVADHPELVHRKIAGYDFIDDDNDPSNDLDGHGTHVTGTIAAQGNNSVGISGVCMNNVKIMPVRVLDGNGSGTSDGIIRGLQYAMNNNADVVNMSLGGDGRFDDQAFHDMIKQLHNAGIILVAAAGNNGEDPYTGVDIPAAYDECIAVSAVGPYEAPAPYSSFGPQVDIAAPGGDVRYGSDIGGILSTVVDFSSGNPVYSYDSTNWQGTSMACPHVAGAAALLLSNGVPAGSVRGALEGSARAPSIGGMDRNKYGNGILDVQAALADAYVRIVKPARGEVTNNTPSFTIVVKGVSPESIKVYLDYSDQDDNGIPDDSSERQIIDSTNITKYYTATDRQDIIEFSWPDQYLNTDDRNPLSKGYHRLYVSGTSVYDGTQVSDWVLFKVTSTVIKAGIHLCSFPYAFKDSLERITNSPSVILPGTDFSYYATERSKLMKWIAAPRSSYDLNPTGYVDYVPDSSFDKTWVNPMSIISGNPIPLGGGYFTDLLGEKNFVSPAGSGYWLILPEDIEIDETVSKLEDLPNFDSSKGFEMPVYKGWNMIGNPYDHSVSWKSALFTYKGKTKSLLDAERAGWVSSTMYGYENAEAGYKKVSNKAMLEPYTGYWLYALVGGISESETLTLNMLP